MICTEWTNEAVAGLLPLIFLESDPRPAVEQIKARYAHGGGFHPFEGFTLRVDSGRAFLDYPGDPPMKELSSATLHKEELLILFEGSWVAVVQTNGDYVVTRMD